MTEGNWRHEQWRKALKERRAKQKRRESVIKKVLAGAALVGAAVICAGFYDGDQVRVETVYTVQPNDTLWSISEEYLKRNTGGRRYILEFKEGIKELNPWLIDSKEQVQPGDKVTISYWVKKEEVESR
jgi:nucleoid-associated protein YgaU